MEAVRIEAVKSLVELRLFGIETESDNRDLYTFERAECGHIEVRGVTLTTTRRGGTKLARKTQ